MRNLLSWVKTCWLYYYCPFTIIIYGCWGCWTKYWNCWGYCCGCGWIYWGLSLDKLSLLLRLLLVNWLLNLLLSLYVVHLLGLLLDWCSLHSLILAICSNLDVWITLRELGDMVGYLWLSLYHLRLIFYERLLCKSICLYLEVKNGTYILRRLLIDLLLVQ